MKCPNCKTKCNALSAYGCYNCSKENYDKEKRDANCTKDVDKDDDWKDDNIKTFEFLKGARFSSNEEKINDDKCVNSEHEVEK